MLSALLYSKSVPAMELYQTLLPELQDTKGIEGLVFSSKHHLQGSDAGEPTWQCFPRHLQLLPMEVAISIVWTFQVSISLQSFTRKSRYCLDSVCLGGGGTHFVIPASPPPPTHFVYLVNGAIEGIKAMPFMVMGGKCSEQQAGIMIPIPMLPLYNSALTELSAYIMSFYKCESKSL